MATKPTPPEGLQQVKAAQNNEGALVEPATHAPLAGALGASRRDQRWHLLDQHRLFGDGGRVRPAGGARAGRAGADLRLSIYDIGTPDRELLIVQLNPTDQYIAAEPPDYLSFLSPAGNSFQS